MNKQEAVDRFNRTCNPEIGGVFKLGQWYAFLHDLYCRYEIDQIQRNEWTKKNPFIV